MDWTPIAVIGVIILAVIIVGPKKLEQWAYGAGRSLGLFKKGRMDVEREIREATNTSPPTPPAH
jgi:Sec-independent protein translocase protein TatA